MGSEDAAPGWYACAEIVEKGDPGRFAAGMAAPVADRAVLFPLYALNVEVARAPWVTQEAMIAEMRLQWWHDALGEIAAGGEVRRHEVTTPLAAILRPQQAALLQESVEARRWDIYRDPFDDEAALDCYLDQTAGHLMWVAVEALGGGDETLVRSIARAAAWASYLKALPELEARGRRPLVDGRPEAIAARSRAALALLDMARPSKLPARIRPALFPAALARPILKQAIAAPQTVAQGGLSQSRLSRGWRFFLAQRGRL